MGVVVLTALQIQPTKIDKLKATRLPTELSNDLAYLCGVLAGDGNIRIQKHKYNYVIKCVGNPKNEMEFYDKILYKLFLKLFNYKIKPKLLDSKTTYGFEFASKSLVLFFTKIIGLPCGRKDAIQIPEIILENRELTRSFVQGLMDTDGCFTVKHRKKYEYPSIVYVSKSKIMIDQVSDFLLTEGFRPVKYTRKVYDKRFSKTVITYDVSLNGNAQTLDWMRKIGFRHPKHLSKFEKWKKIAEGRFEHSEA